MNVLNYEATPSYRHIDEDVHITDSPIKEVRTVVNPHDDLTLNQLTLRVWVLGLIACCIQAHFRAISSIEKNPFDVPMVVVQFATLFLGHVMAYVLPNKIIHIPCTGKVFALNPGGFSIKENVLISLFGHMGRQTPQVLQAIVLATAYFDKKIHFLSSYMTVLFSQLTSFLFVGLFINWASVPEMWWPKDLLDVAFFRACHERNDGTRHISYRWFFIICFVISLFYEMFPGFLFPSLSCISVLCLLFKRSVLAQQIGSGKSGLGWFSFSMNWSSAADYADPLATPHAVVYNVMVGAILGLCIMTPAIYFTNSFNTKKFPIFSFDLFDKYGSKYDIRRVVNSDGLSLNLKAYKEYSPILLSASAVSMYGLMLAAVACALLYVLMTYGRELWNQIKQDRYRRLMRNYEPLPRFWFFLVFILALIFASISADIGLGPEVELPLGGILLSCVVVLVMIVPAGIFVATTGQMMPVNIVFQILGGYLYSGKPIQYTILRSCAAQSIGNSVFILGSLKLAHYVKVAPRAVFNVVLVGLVVGSSVGFLDIWLRMDSIKETCLKEKLPTEASENCQWLDILYTTTRFWGIIGPVQLAKDGIYTWFLLVFVIITMIVQALLCLFNEKVAFLQKVNLPIILATMAVPTVTPAGINLWVAIGILVPKILVKYFNNESYIYQYLLSVSLTAGAGLLAFFLKLAKSSLKAPEDHCPLSTCPIAKGCPG